MSGPKMHGKADWDTEIRSDRAWWKLELDQLWHYKDLLFLLVKRDITAQYKQTLLGPAWLVMQPLLTTLTYVAMFGMIARSAPAGIPPVLFYVSGIVPWTYFANVVNKTSRSLIGNSAVLTKVYFPRLVMPLSATLSSLFTFLVQMALVFLIMAGYALSPEHEFSVSFHLLYFPVLVVLMSLLGLGAGMIVSAMTTTYRDMGFLVGFAVQLLMFASPVIFPLSMIEERAPQLVPILNLNPMTPVIETMRSILFGGAVDAMGLMRSGLFAGVLLAVGLILFQRVERSFADTI